MIEDIDGPSAKPLTADICIIGAGAAGLTLASELRNSGLSILLLEAGRRRHDGATQALYDSDVVGLPHGGVHSLRLRVFGGSTTQWAGQVLPLSEIDFSQRNWVPHSGWPMTRQSLEPYYRRVSALLGVPPFPPDACEAWPSELAPPLPFGDGVTSLYSVFTATPDFAKQHGQWLKTSLSVRAVLGANVVTLRVRADGGHVVAAVIRSLRGRQIAATAERFVVCLGGIETPRLLLASSSAGGGVLGNGNDLAGRYFQDHPGFLVGRIHEPSQQLRDAFRPHRRAGVKYQPRLALDAPAQTRERLIHTGAGVLFDAAEHRSVSAGKSLIRGVVRRAPMPSWRDSARQVLRHPMPLARAAWRYYGKGEPAQDTSGQMFLTVGGEQVPDPESRVRLSTTKRDALGMPRTVLDWRMDPLELRSYRRMAERMAGELERLDLGKVDLDAFALSDDPSREAHRVVDSGHHMGTARMAEDPRDGVVDTDCQMHGVDNLYLAGSSVFPTGGHSNPTYSILALTLRLADELRR